LGLETRGLSPLTEDRGPNVTRAFAIGMFAVAALSGAIVLLRPGSAATSASKPSAIEGLAPAAQTSFDSTRAWAHLEALVTIGPRPAGSPQIRQARAYITRELRALNLNVQEQPFTADTPIGRVEVANLIVRLAGRRPERLLFGGHYDTKLFADQVFVGASDGASSAAFLIELARVLSTRPLEHTVELIWFDGEEAVRDWVAGGLDHTYGSRYYVQAARRAGSLASIRALILVDMIGDRDLVIRRDSMSTPWLTDLVWAAARRVGHGSTFVDESMPIDDDHVPFLEAGVPAVDIIDLDYPAWHTPDDNLDRVSARSLQIVGDVVLAALPDLDARLTTAPSRP
jgi:glutaminyl-peptide cyclotransferase